VVVGAGVIVLGAIAVLRWLPARATDVPPVAPVAADDSVSVVPSDRMPVDVVPADIVSADPPRLADVGVTREPA
jgi:hypothetical protein